MTNLPWMPLYIGDVLAETAHLSAEEFGAYMALTMHYWRHGSLPSDENRLAQVAKTGFHRWDDVKQIVQPLFGDGWKSERLETLRATQEETHIKRVEAGRKGGMRRQEVKPGYKPGLKPGSSIQNQNQNHNQITNTKSPSEAYSEGSALEKGNWGTNTREEAYVSSQPFAIPATIDEGTRFLTDRGVPRAQFEYCLRTLMEGDLYPIDIEGYETHHRKGRSDAA